MCIVSKMENSGKGRIGLNCCLGELSNLVLAYHASACVDENLLKICALPHVRW